MSMTLMAVVGMTCGLATSDLNNYAQDLNLPITFTDEADLRAHSGFLPAQVAGIESGVETYFADGSEAVKTLPPNEVIDEKHSGVVTFRWGGDFTEGATALYIAYLLGEKCEAVLFETQSGRYIPSHAAKDGAEAMMAME